MSKRFQTPNIFWWLSIVGAIFLIFLLAHYPNVIPYSNLSIVGDYLLNLVTNYRTLLIIVFWSTVIAHAYEAILARRICQELKIDQQSTLLWTIQTFILGKKNIFH